MSHIGAAAFDMRGLWGRLVAPIAGMAFFWAYFRYQVVFMVLYPQGSFVALGPVSIPSHGAFLLSLTLLSCFALTRGAHLERLIRTRPLACAGVGAAGALGGVLALAALGTTGTAHTALAWASTLLVGCGFLACFLMWALTLSQGFSATQLVVLSTSYLASLMVFRPGTGIPREFFSLAVPLGSSACWLATAFLAGRSAPEDERPPSIRALLDPPIWLFAAFLLAGSVIRGIIDCVVLSMEPRRFLSIPITALLTAACVVYWLVARRRDRTDALPFVLGCWIGFACLFFVGVFAFLVADEMATGGALVVIARSMLEVVLWMFLCDYAHRRHAPVVPLFIVGGMFVEIVSWAISYVAIPAWGAQSVAQLPDPHVLALVAIFGLIAVITAACGVLLVLQSAHRTDAPPSALAEPADDIQLADAFERTHGLTPREATVALLYARGYSLSKVAEELGVSTSSAQTSIKNAYRKLGVHSKDELIGVVEGLRRA